MCVYLFDFDDSLPPVFFPTATGVPVNPKNDQAPDTKEVPKGLQVWREAVGKAETAAQLAMCTYMLETAVAWDKSIMKAVSVCWVDLGWVRLGVHRVNCVGFI